MNARWELHHLATIDVGISAIAGWNDRHITAAIRLAHLADYANGDHLPGHLAEAIATDAATLADGAQLLAEIAGSVRDAAHELRTGTHLEAAA